MISGGWKAYFGLECNCKSIDLWLWDKKKPLLETLVTLVLFMVVKFGIVASLQNCGK